MLRQIISLSATLALVIPVFGFTPKPNPAPSGTGGAGSRAIPECRYDPNGEPCVLTTLPTF